LSHKDFDVESELRQVQGLLEKMSSSATVKDYCTVITSLTRILSYFKSKEDEWGKREEANGSVFVRYHAYRNLRLITQKMRERFSDELKELFVGEKKC